MASTLTLGDTAIFNKNENGSKIGVSKMGDIDTFVAPYIIKNVIYLCRFTNGNWCYIEFDTFNC
ncbi:hypothetical protein LXL04_004475 [Taraxacum kok-saghyz]